MAELQLWATERHPKLRDGSILCAYNDERIATVHAQHICNIRHVRFNRDGLRIDGLAKKRLAIVSKFHMVRIASTVVESRNLITGQRVQLSLNAIADVIAQRKKHPLHKLFGTAGREEWYEGNRDIPASVVWTMIEEHSANQQVNHQRWVFHPKELIRDCCILVNDGRVDEFAAMCEPEYATNDHNEIWWERREEPVLGGDEIVSQSVHPAEWLPPNDGTDWRRLEVNPRKHRVRYEEFAELSKETIRQIRDDVTSVDLRDTLPVKQRTVVVTEVMV